MPKRIFVSIDLPKEVKDYLLSLQNHGIYWIKWMKAQNLHITLNFLGDLDETRINKARLAILEVAKIHTPFSLMLKSVRSENDMLWIMPEVSESLERVQEDLKTAFESRRIGKRERRYYRAHILLAKSKTGRYMKWKPDNFKPIEFEVGRVTLYESKLTPGAATHRLIQSFDLGKPSPSIPLP